MTTSGWMVAFTGGLVVIAAVQAGLFLWQLWLMRYTAGLTRDSANAAQKSADAAEKAANAALGVELPRLEVSDARMTGFISFDFDNARTLGEPVEQETIVNVNVPLINRGRNEAVLIETCAVMVLGELTSIAVYPREATISGMLGKGVPPGKEHRVSFPLGNSLTSAEMQKVSNGTNLWVIGYVIYRDFLEQQWRSKFCLTPRAPDGSVAMRMASEEYPHYTGREPFDPTAPRTELVDDMPGLVRSDHA